MTEEGAKMASIFKYAQLEPLYNEVNSELGKGNISKRMAPLVSHVVSLLTPEGNRFAGNYPEREADLRKFEELLKSYERLDPAAVKDIRNKFNLAYELAPAPPPPPKPNVVPSRSEIHLSPQRAENEQKIKALEDKLREIQEVKQEVKKDIKADNESANMLAKAFKVEVVEAIKAVVDSKPDTPGKKKANLLIALTGSAQGSEYDKTVLKDALKRNSNAIIDRIADATQPDIGEFAKSVNFIQKVLAAFMKSVEDKCGKKPSGEVNLSKVEKDTSKLYSDLKSSAIKGMVENISEKVTDMAARQEERNKKLPDLENAEKKIRAELDALRPQQQTQEPSPSPSYQRR